MHEERPVREEEPPFARGSMLGVGEEILAGQGVAVGEVVGWLEKSVGWRRGQACRGGVSACGKTKSPPGMGRAGERSLGWRRLGLGRIIPA